MFCLIRLVVDYPPLTFTFTHPSQTHWCSTCLLLIAVTILFQLLTIFLIPLKGVIVIVMTVTDPLLGLEETKWLTIFLPNSQCLLAVPIPHFRLYCLVRRNTWFPGHLKSAKVLARSPNCYIFHRIWNVSVSANLIKHSHKRTTKTFVRFVWDAVDSPPSYNTGDASLACNVL